MMSAIEYPSFEAELAAIDFSDLEAKYACRLDENYGNILIIDHLPTVDTAKEEKLLAVLKKKYFGPANAELVDGGVFMPKGEDGQSKGYGFFQFLSVEQAEAAYGSVHGVRLDKSHQLYAIRFNDFDRLAQVPDDYVAPEIEEYKEKEYLKDWLSDPMARDQFATLSAGNAVQVCWGPRSGPAEIVEERKPWTDAYIHWSPKGSYMATVHGPGVMLWGGRSWTRLGRFPHENVKFISFSQDETYLVTMSLPDLARPAEQNMMVWDIQSGVLVRAMQVEPTIGEEPIAWPILKFSHDDKFAAMAAQGNLSIYETAQGFSLVDKKPLEVPGIKEVSWSPVDYKLVYWVHETNNIPARVAMIDAPSKMVLRTKNLFNVDSCAFAWQSNGDYLSVQVNRFAGKNKKTLSTNLEIFRLREKNIPVEVLEYKETLQAVSWEPNGERLLCAVPAEFKSIINFYTMKGPDSTIKLLASVERKQVERFFWSPSGTNLIMADLGSANAFLEFWNVNEMALMATKEHFLATDVQWDPSGRYVTSFVSVWKHNTTDTGYCIWDMKGDLIAKQSLPRFATFLWRPRPETLLSGDKLKEIKKNYKSYATSFEAADLLASNMESSDSAAVRLAAVRVWNDFRTKCLERRAANDEKRKALVSTVQTKETAVADQWIEEVLEEIEEAI